MGCAATRTQKIETKSIPKINITIGKRINRRIASRVKVVFIFGGPGSKKGTIVEELSENYGFHVIDVENIILNNLPNQNGENENCEENSTNDNNYIENVKRTETILKVNSNILTIDWILENVSNELKKADDLKHKMCLIDFLPKLPFLLRTEIFSRECFREMNEFEKQWPNVFALNFSSRKAQIAEEMIRFNLEEIESEDGLNEKNDEKDQKKMKKRYDFYLENSKELIKYFKIVERLVTVDISGSLLPESLSTCITSLFCELGFQASLNVTASNKLTIFLIKKIMHHVGVSNQDKTDCNNLALLKNLKYDMQKTKPTTDVLVVELEDLVEIPITPTQRDGAKIPKEVYFLHPIEPFVATKSTTQKLKRFPFKAFALTEKQVCYFPDWLTVQECGRIWRSKINEKVP